VRLLASSVGVARVQRPYHRDALEEISRLFFSRAEQRRSGQWEEQDGQKAGRAATNPISRSVENNGLPEDTHVLASVTRHRPEPWRHRTCGFVESGRSHPTRNAKAMPSAPHPGTTRTSAASGPPLLSQRYFASFRPEPPVARKGGVRFHAPTALLRSRFRVVPTLAASRIPHR
jgi:hypothetical protein